MRLFTGTAVFQSQAWLLATMVSLFSKRELLLDTEPAASQRQPLPCRRCTAQKTGW